MLIRIYSFLFLVLFPIQSWAVEVHGHRGARALRPENTLPAFEYALQQGVDVLELDLHVTKDKKLILSHDPKISKEHCLAPGGKPIQEEPVIYSLTLSQVKEYDCGSLKHPQFPKQTPVPKTPMPTLAEVFKLVNESKEPVAKKVRFNIETKMDPPEMSPSPEEFVALVVKELEAFQMVDRTILQSFDFRTLKEAKKTHPKLVISALVEDPKIVLGQIPVPKKFEPEIISPDWQILFPEAVAKLHKRGVKVVPWTANDPVAWKKLLDMGVDGIITDDPKGLIDYLALIKR